MQIKWDKMEILQFLTFVYSKPSNTILSHNFNKECILLSLMWPPGHVLTLTQTVWYEAFISLCPEIGICLAWSMYLVLEFNARLCRHAHTHKHTHMLTCMCACADIVSAKCVNFVKFNRMFEYSACSWFLLLHTRLILFKKWTIFIHNFLHCMIIPSN
jgi:hypothetical protein